MPPKHHKKRKPKGKKKPTRAELARDAAAPPAVVDSGAAERFKQQGNDAFKSGDYAAAIREYSKAIDADGTNHVLYSNRSAAHLSAGDAAAAESDARECVSLNGSWAKGHIRLGDALLSQSRQTEAVRAYASALSADPTNASAAEKLMAARASSGASGSAAAAPLPSDVPPSSSSSSSSSSSPPPPPQPPLAPETVIGIDLGTTNSCVAVWEGGRVSILADPADGQRTVPSVVAFRGNERFVGRAAMSQDPKNTVFDAKRLIGQSYDDPQVHRDARHFAFAVEKGASGKPVIAVQYRGTRRQFAPEEISAMVLEKMKSIAEHHLGHAVRKAVVTVPAYFNDAQRNATKAAGRIAGLDVLRIVNEPTAAALAYGLDRKAKEEGPSAAANDSSSSSSSGAGGETGAVADATNVLIFDLGGGTFDVSLLSIEDGIFEVKATGGDTHLGGEDFDNALVEHCCTVIQKTTKEDVRASSSAMRRLRTECERAKRALSTATTATVKLESPDVSVPVSRAKFESLNAHMFRSCMDTVTRVLRDAGVKPAEVSDVVLVGGSTRIPKVQEMLRAAFGGMELCKDINPDEAVAYGAAVQAAVLSGALSSASSSTDLLLVDVAPLSLGIETTGGVMSTVVKRNTPIPCKKAQRYSTEDDFQTEIDVKVFEGERPLTKDNHYLGQFAITGIKSAKRGEPKIDVTFQLDANGILTVAAVDADTGAQASTTIANSPGHISTEAVAEMIRTAEANRAADEAARECAEARTELQHLCKDVKDFASASANATLTALADAHLAWTTSEAGMLAPLATIQERYAELRGRFE